MFRKASNFLDLVFVGSIVEAVNPGSSNIFQAEYAWIDSWKGCMNM